MRILLAGLAAALLGVPASSLKEPALIATIPTGTHPCGVVAAFGSVWVANDGGTLVRIDPRPEANPRRRRRVLHGRRRARPLDRQLQGRPRPGDATRSCAEDRGRRDPGQRPRRLRTGLGDDLGSRQARSRRPTESQGRPPGRPRPAPSRPRRAYRRRLGRLRQRRNRHRTREPAHPPDRPDRRGRARAERLRRRDEGPLDPGEHGRPGPLRSRREARPRTPRGRADARTGRRRPRRDDLGPRQGAEHRVPGRSGKAARDRLVPGRPGRLRDPSCVRVDVGDELRGQRRAAVQARRRPAPGRCGPRPAPAPGEPIPVASAIRLRASRAPAARERRGA
jgi:hypothetical protein